MDDIAKSLQNLVESQQKQLQAAAITFKNAALMYFAPVFEDTAVKNFSWKQFTVYFNDGDTCNFDVYCDEYYLSINGECVEDDEDSTYKPKTIKLISKLVGNIPAVILELAYGDHTEVIVSKDKIKVESYDDHN